MSSLCLSLVHIAVGRHDVSALPGPGPSALRPHSWALLRLLSTHFYSAVVQEEDTLLGWSPLVLALKGHIP